jgi:hypothetical protein
MGKKIRLWEDNWLGSTSLAIQFWPIYRILYEQGKTIAELWDGTNLKCTFRRNFSEALYQSWLEIVELVSTIELTEEEDEMVWQYTSKGTYSSQSLYKIKISEGLNKCMFLQFGALRSLLEYICLCGFSLIIEP